ncbi:peptidyl-prolyl cis-trans isomerase FKBP4-like isoform X3 [Dreissena polymorpha]|uniref:peptidylprolyl isomerase n=1 Tax=Dreissena polymorpha TaxID=45954 RepID=A0A9D4S4M6_DREPO|nr:peptidyl-prolyl cis-trans isomerase FKBP4-like isoform X2 [Dreissena polymorpha]XP_052241053.1 peptidyl-prolyl cis-trans isomerase FKBP4-like isoform X3 [Dreissena polymorpha]KAH3890323.1 hypothetical protein DPMN_014400 [Dreissena polymorpha]
MTSVFRLERHPAGCDMEVGESVDITPDQDGGVIKRLIKKGAGDDYPNTGDTVYFNYIGYTGETVADEFIFDTSERDGHLFKHEVLKGQVIRGFEMGILTMKVGERAILYIKSSYAFGPKGQLPKIPPNISVIFDTEIIRVECQDLSEKEDLSILKKVLIRGKGHGTPNFGGEICADIKCYYGDTVYYDKKGVQFLLGEGSTDGTDFPMFVEDLLICWKCEEIARLYFASHQAYGKKGFPKYNIPPDQNLHFIVKLVKFEQNSDFWEMDNPEKLEKCDSFKQKGNMYFQKEEYPIAAKFYEMMVEYVEHEYCMEGEEEQHRAQIFLNGNLNLAQTYLKMEKFIEAIECCDKAIKSDPNNPKAYYRRGMAQLSCMDHENALKDFQKTYELEPENKAALRKIDECRRAEIECKRKQRENDRRMMSGLGQNQNNGATSDGGSSMSD